MAASDSLVVEISGPLKTRRRRATSTISSKGQITVPIEIRERLGVKQGDCVEFVVENGLTILRPVSRENNPFARFVGALGGFETQDDIVAWVQEMRDPDQEYL